MFFQSRASHFRSDFSCFPLAFSQFFSSVAYKIERDALPSKPQLLYSRFSNISKTFLLAPLPNTKNDRELFSLNLCEMFCFVAPTTTACYLQFPTFSFIQYFFITFLLFSTSCSPLETQHAPSLEAAQGDTPLTYSEWFHTEAASPVRSTTASKP